MKREARSARHDESGKAGAETRRETDAAARQLLGGFGSVDAVVPAGVSSSDDDTPVGPVWSGRMEKAARSTGPLGRGREEVRKLSQVLEESAVMLDDDTVMLVCRTVAESLLRLADGLK